MQTCPIGDVAKVRHYRPSSPTNALADGPISYQVNLNLLMNQLGKKFLQSS